MAKNNDLRIKMCSCIYVGMYGITAQQSEWSDTGVPAL